MAASPRFFQLHASANALGGALKTPHKKVIPSQASSALPAVGGHTTSRTESFNCDEIVRCRSAYTRVTSSQEDEPNGSWVTLVSSVVEGLNILDAVKAERIVGQISIEHPADGSPVTFSLAGSHFDGLKLGGLDVSPTLNPALLGVGSGDGVGFSVFQQTGNVQAGKIVQNAKSGKNAQWVLDRFNWMTAKPKGDAEILCSLVDGIAQAVPGRCFGHAVEIPHFGKIFLGEMLVGPSSVQLSMVRAELGCATTGSVAVSAAAARGGHYPP
jgi:hypothetical protein